jgi:hypothetical protein
MHDRKVRMAWQTRGGWRGRGGWRVAWQRCQVVQRRCVAGGAAAVRGGWCGATCMASEAAGCMGREKSRAEVRGYARTADGEGGGQTKGSRLLDDCASHGGSTRAWL